MLNKTYKKNSIVLLLILMLVTCMLKLPSIFWWVETSVWKYYILPIMWSSILGIIVFIMPRIHPVIRITKQENIYFEAMIFAFILLAVQYLAGVLIYAVGKTPYDLTLKGIRVNILSVILPFIVIEYIRGYVISSFSRKKNIVIFIFMTLLTTFFNMNLHKVIALKSLEDITIYIASQVGPELCKNILLSYLVLYGGPIASICYGGILLVFHWFCPILPDLNWLAQGVIGIVVPIFEVMFIVEKYNTTYVKRERSKMELKDTLSWSFTLVFSVVLLWFVVGVFPIFPSVIVTGSMKPLIDPGDVILVKQFYSEEEIKALQVGDIIYFKRDDIMITHRILEVVYDEKGNYSFETKGDNNSAEDIRLVLPEEVIGKYVLVIPKIGYPTLWLKANKIEQREDVVN